MGRKALSHHGNPGALPVTFLPHLPQCSLSLRGRGCVVEESVGARYPTVGCPLHVDKLWPSIIVPSTVKRSCFDEG